MADPAALAGWTVVLTRPAQSARESIDTLHAAGAHAICLPVLEIEALEVAPSPNTAHSYAAIFVSANAVMHGLPRLRATGLGLNAPCFAVGETTAAALKTMGQTQVHVPTEGFDSEHLLALPALQDVAGRTIVLVKGEGTTAGRTLIEDTLTGRGATIETFVCYRRCTVTPDATQLYDVLELLDSSRNVVVVVASGESLMALLSAFGQHRNTLQRAVLAVPHARVAAMAREAGFSRIWIVALSAAGLVESLSGHTAGLKTNE
jgi:uroporphyrinogen-III synthase